jgi:glycosyltransferase involved in cell wall biosynthesis
MRIGYILKKFPRISETFILNEILELSRQGCEVTVFSLHKPDDGLFHRKLADLGQPVVYLPTRKTSAALAHLQDNLPVLKERRDAFCDQLEGLLEERRPDVWSIMRWGMDIALEAQRRGIEHFHAHFATIATYVARTASAIAEIPYSFTCHAKDIYREGVSPERFQRLAKPAAFVITVCQANRDHILTSLAPDAAVRVLYNGIDLSVFHPDHRETTTSPIVLGVGRLVEKKGFCFLIEAVADLHRAGADFDCVIVGEGDQRQALEEQIALSGSDRIRLAGLQTQDETRAYMARSTLLALPCIVGADGNRDALPTVLLEAMASGVPVISTPVAGVAEIVDDGRAGVLVPMQDADALQTAIARLLDDVRERESLREAGRARAEECFDLAKNVATLRGYFAANGSRGSTA